MKNLFYSLSLLIAFTSWATPLDLETLSLNINEIEKSFTKIPDCELDALFKVNKGHMTDEAEMADEAFDFDTAAYLPVGFNANATYLSEISEIALEEEDEAFDFNTAEYLPVGFNANEMYLSEISEITLEEEDEAFDFNTADYLPVGFSVYNLLEGIVDIEIIEEDEPFDFNTKDYLPSTFDAYVNFHESKAVNYLSCIAAPSI